MAPKLEPGERLSFTIDGKITTGTVTGWADEGTVVITTEDGEEIHVKVGHELRALSPLKKMDS